MEPEVTTPQPEKQAPIETLPPKPIWKSKFLWGFMAVSFIAAFIIGGLALGRNQAIKKQALTPTPTSAPVDETANWKTYDVVGIATFKYPPNWLIKTGKDPMIYLYDPASATKAIQNGGSTVTVYASYFQVDNVEYPDGGMTPEGAAATYEDGWKKISPTTDLHRSNGKVNGYEAEIIDAAGEGSSGRNVYIGSGMYTIDINSSIKNLSGNSTENQILSTFKFTN